MLVKSSLVHDIKQVDTDAEGQIWVELSKWPNLKLGGIYIPPDDSPHYHPAQYGTFARHTLDAGKVVAIGDFNARVGTPRITDTSGNTYEYRGVKDDSINSHGRTLVNLCNNNSMVIANHICHNGRNFGGELSFKRRSTWISEIDLCLVKGECIDLIKDINVHQDIPGSDHAPLTVTLATDSLPTLSPAELLQRASALGQRYEGTPQHKLPKSVNHRKIDVERFTNALQEIAPPDFAMDGMTVDVDKAVTEGCRTIIDTAATFTLPHSEMQHEWDETHPRWKSLLDSKDSKLI